MKGSMIRLAALLLIVLTGSLAAQGKKGKTEFYSLSATALLGPSSTEVCVLVQTSDPANHPVPNQIEKLQIKVLNDAGDVVFMQNASDVPLVDGEVCVGVTGLLPMMPVSVQAHIGSGKNKEVAGGSTNVLLRPDLIVAQVNSPAQSTPNASFNIVALVQEKNLQAGASAAVSLWEGETLLSDVTDVQIEAGGEVSVVFQGVSFAEAGTHNLTVRVSDADPAEYESGNNEHSFSIEIVNSVYSLFYQLSYSLTKNYRRSMGYTYCGVGSSEVTTGGNGSWTFYTDFISQTQSPIDSIKWESVSANGTLSTFSVYGLTPVRSTAEFDDYYHMLTDADGSWQSVSVSVNKSTQQVTLSTERYASDEVYVVSYEDGTVERRETRSNQMNLEGFLEVRLLFADDGKQAGGAGRIDVAPFLPHAEAYYEVIPIEGCDYVLWDSLSYDYSENAANGTTDPTVLPSHATGSLPTIAAANVPLVNELMQNYPNPFNPATTVQFTVEKSGPTVLMIYDMLGREVAELFRGHAEKGRVYRYTFQASNVASGMYYARLYSGGNSYVMKMMLMK